MIAVGDIDDFLSPSRAHEAHLLNDSVVLWDDCHALSAWGRQLINDPDAQLSEST
jgi:hypothetical protein